MPGAAAHFKNALRLDVVREGDQRGGDLLTTADSKPSVLDGRGLVVVHTLLGMCLIHIGTLSWFFLRASEAERPRLAAGGRGTRTAGPLECEVRRRLGAHSV